MIKYTIILLLTLTATSNLCAQYYYNDIVNNKQVLAEFATLKAKKINGVKVISMEATGEATEGFTKKKKMMLKILLSMCIYSNNANDATRNFIKFPPHLAS